jgi:hypothetical protein
MSASQLAVAAELARAERVGGLPPELQVALMVLQVLAQVGQRGRGLVSASGMAVRAGAAGA